MVRSSQRRQKETGPQQARRSKSCKKRIILAMTNFICEEGQDYGATEFTKGSGGKFVSYEEMYENTSLPMCWAGFFKPQWLEICKNII
jgi:hypothetical protein